MTLNAQVLDIETFPITPTCLCPVPVAIGLAGARTFYRHEGSIHLYSARPLNQGLDTVLCDRVWRMSRDSELGFKNWDMKSVILVNVMEEILDDNVDLIGHRIAYDLAVLLHWYLSESRTYRDMILDKIRSGRVFDTRMTEAQILGMSEDAIARAGTGLCQDRSLALSSLTRKYAPHLSMPSKTGTERGWSTRWEELYRVPPEYWPEDATRYLITDLRATKAVAEGMVAQGHELVPLTEEVLNRHIALCKERARTFP